MDEITPSDAAAVIGQNGGRARAEKLSPQRRRQIARVAAQARWGVTDSIATALQGQLDAARTALVRREAELERMEEQHQRERDAVRAMVKAEQARVDILQAALDDYQDG